MSRKDEEAPELSRLGLALPPTSTVPTCDLSDNDLDWEDYEYPDHDSSTSFLVSGPLRNTLDGKHSRRGVARTRQEALVWVRAYYGDRVLREVKHPTRWCFRVRNA